MQKTYNELFKLQNLLEKTVRSVEVKNNLKSIGSVLTRHRASTPKGWGAGRTTQVRLSEVALHGVRFIHRPS